MGCSESVGILQHLFPSINSLVPGKFEIHIRYVIFKRISVTDGWGISREIALIWMSLDFTYDQSTLVQVMAWCHQATSHYLSQCWLRFLSPYGATRPQWILLPSVAITVQHTLQFQNGCSPRELIRVKMRDVQTMTCKEKKLISLIALFRISVATHYSDVTWPSRRLKSPITLLFVQELNTNETQ